MPESTVIIGAGISGLSAAYYLARAGRPSIILDPRPRPGGVIQTSEVDGCLIEGGPDSFLAAKPEAMAMIRELGLEGDVISSNDHLRKTYIRKHGRMVPMPEGLMMVVPGRILPTALSPLFSWQTKMRMALEYFRKPGPPQPDRSIADFIEDHYGREAVDYLAEPLLSGVYGGDPRYLSVNSVLPRFADLANRYGSLTRGVLANRPKQSAAPLFRTLRGGLGQWIDAMLAAIREHCEIRQVRAESVEQIDGGYRVKTGGDWIEAKHVVLAAEAHNSAQLLTGRLADLLGRIAYSSSIVVALGYEGPPPMDGFGFLVPHAERRSILACTWVGTKFPFRAPTGVTLARCFLSGEGKADPAVVHRELKELTGIRAEPKFHRIFRWPRAMAQYYVGHAQLVAEIEQEAAQLPGLYLAGNAFHGIGLPDCVRSGQQAAQRILASDETAR